MTSDAHRLVDLRGLRLLVVDDDADSGDLLHEVLKSAGAVVSSTRNVESALTHLRSEPYDVVISDLAMPGRDGIDLIAAIRTTRSLRGGKLPAIAVSGYPERYEAVATSVGFDAFLRKPVNLDALCAVVRDLAEGRVT